MSGEREKSFLFLLLAAAAAAVSAVSPAAPEGLLAGGYSLRGCSSRGVPLTGSGQSHFAFQLKQL